MGGDQTDTLSLALSPMPLFVGLKHVSAHRNAFYGGYGEHGSVPMTEKTTAGMQQGWNKVHFGEMEGVGGFLTPLIPTPDKKYRRESGLNSVTNLLTNLTWV